MSQGQEALTGCALRRAGVHLWWLRRHPWCARHERAMRKSAYVGLFDLSGTYYITHVRRSLIEQRRCEGCRARTDVIEATNALVRGARHAMLSRRINT